MKTDFARRWHLLWRFDSVFGAVPSPFPPGISTYFNYQESRNKELDLTTQRLKQLESAIMNDENYNDILNETRDNFNMNHMASEPFKLSKTDMKSIKVKTKDSRIPAASHLQAKTLGGERLKEPRAEVRRKSDGSLKKGKKNRGSGSASSEIKSNQNQKGSLSMSGDELERRSNADEAAMPPSNPKNSREGSPGKQPPVELVKVWSTEKEPSQKNLTDQDFDDDDLNVDNLQ